jgi:N-acetylglucosaminyldiphosphoundecaprenol N-acetyl-beta-D-mannosaminyltransferase
MNKISTFVDKRLRVVALRINVTSFGSAAARIVELAAAGRGAYVCCSTVHMVMESHDNSEFATIVNAADMIVPDGMPLVWMQKLQGAKSAERVRANDLMMRLFQISSEKQIKIGFYGSRQEVLDQLIERARREFPQLNIAYSCAPPFRPLTPEENETITAEINSSGAQILFMGLGCPKQERWMAAHKDALKCVMIGVGASFDFYAGNVAECPHWMQMMGLEWLFRLAQEPKRLWKRYLILNPRFLWQAFRQLLRKKNK